MIKKKITPWKGGSYRRRLGDQLGGYSNFQREVIVEVGLGMWTDLRDILSYLYSFFKNPSP